MNIQHIKNLLRLYFIENWKRDVIWTFGILCLATLLFVQMNPREYSNAPEIIVAVIFLAITPDRLFKNIGRASQRIHYMMIPATSKEKIVTNILLANIYMVLGIAISIFVGYSLSYLILELRNIPDLPSYMERYASLGTWDLCGWLTFEAALSIYFFGSIYFRRKGFIKTIGVCAALGITFFLLYILVIGLNARCTLGPASADWISYNLSIYDSLEPLYIVGNIIAIIFFYGLSFLRMKETEA